MAPKRVLHTVEDLKIGGIETLIASIAAGLDPTRFTVEVWCLARGGRIADELAEKGIPVNILGMKSYYNPLHVLRLGRLMREGRFHVLHTHGYFAGTFSRMAAPFGRVPVIIHHVHSTYTHYSPRNIRIERFLSRFTDQTVCISKAVQNFVLQTLGVRKDKTRVIYNGVPSHVDESCGIDRETMRARLGIKKEDLAIIVVAHLTANKGHQILFEAMDLLGKKALGAKLIVVGDGPLRSDLQSLASRLGIAPAVIFAGYRRDVMSLLRMSDLCVLPTQTREGLGIALLEAMAMGLPVVGSNLGGIPEVIEEGETGFLVAPGSSAELSQAIERLARDPSLRQRMGRKGRERYEQKFTLQKMLHHIESLYDELLGRTVHER